MRKVLFVIPSLEPSGAAKQLTLLAPGLPHQKFETRICVLGCNSPFARPLHEAGLAIHVLGWTRRFDLRRFLMLRRLVQEFDPDVIHVWGVPALALVHLAGGRARGNGTPARRIVVSAPRPPGPKGTGVRRLTRWLLGWADCVAVNGPAEAERYRRLGVSPSRLTVVSPAVALRKAPLGEEADLRRSLRLPPGSRLVVCAGPLQPHKGFGDALWAYDILAYIYADLSLLVIGSGPDRQRLEQMARQAKLGSVHFLGPQADAAGLLAQADVVWVPSLAEGGLNVALEAMAAGRPVVATKLPGLAQIIGDGRDGFLVPPGDKVALARQTRLLFNDAARRRQIGAAARARVTRQFAVPEMCRHFTSLYESASA